MLRTVEVAKVESEGKSRRNVKEEYGGRMSTSRRNCLTSQLEFCIGKKAGVEVEVGSQGYLVPYK